MTFFACLNGRSIFILLLLSLSFRAFSQENSLIGAWINTSSDQQISLFIKADGRILRYIGEKGKTILERDIIEGKYEYVNNKLIIRWQDNTSQEFKTHFKDKYSLVLKNLGKKQKKLFFRKVVDSAG